MPATRDYVDVIYNERDRPLTAYPDKLARYLFDRYEMSAGVKLLEVGCGRGEFLRGFISAGAEGHGVDRSRAAEKYCPEASLKIADLEIEGLPYADDAFEVVYSKSVIEHFHNPEKLVMEIFRVLKPGGLVLTMCPDWEFNYKMYFEDYTHRTPFMQASLRDIHLIHGFEDVRVERFRQLPVLWSRSWLVPFSEMTRILAPGFLKPRNKWIRFSKEIMLLSSARKPLAEPSRSTT
ncbi:MAG: methyltransferase domain-containing protein [Gemmatimonadaceae bacterium]|nr:methyltransferase domain-containing protein [Gemmatimonadaceae bacterium]MBA3655778.1 methyltransferase domain-containing protein [Gemmatimonadaceae bacterium]